MTRKTQIFCFLKFCIKWYKALSVNIMNGNYSLLLTGYECKVCDQHSITNGVYFYRIQARVMDIRLVFHLQHYCEIVECLLKDAEDPQFPLLDLTLISIYILKDYVSS